MRLHSHHNTLRLRTEDERGNKKEGTASNKDKARSKYLNVYTSQTKMPKCQYKNKINKKGNMEPLESSYPTSTRPEHVNTAEI